jgi:hypothetical protein
LDPRRESFARTAVPSNFRTSRGSSWCCWHPGSGAGKGDYKKLYDYSLADDQSKYGAYKRLENFEYVCCQEVIDDFKDATKSLADSKRDRLKGENLDSKGDRLPKKKVMNISYQ